MQKAEHILSMLGRQSEKHPDYVYRRLYRYLYNPGIYTYAMAKRSIHNTTQYMDKIDPLIEELRMERCDWGHPLKTQLVGYAISELLQAIYRPLALPCAKNTFKDALLAIQSTSPPFGWSIEMPSIDFFYQMEPDRFCSRLKTKIEDGRLLNALRQLIRVQGWSIDWLNLLLQELDRWMISQGESITYIRYNEHILLLVKASKADARAILKRMNRFLLQQFGLRDFDCYSRIRFFGEKRYYFGDYELKNIAHRQIGLFIPKMKVDQRLQPFQKDGKPKAVSLRLHLPIEVIISRYRKERIDFESYCDLAWNRSKRIRFFRYIHFYSLVKTIARKKNLSAKQARQKYREKLQAYWT